MLDTFDEISNSRTSTWNRESSTNAGSLLLAVSQFEFLFSLVLAVALQHRSIDVCTAYKEVNTVKRVLLDVRENVEQYHRKWYEKAELLCHKVNGSSPAIPRSCTRQTQRDNVPATTPEEYHKRASLTIHFLDHMISYIETRFSTSIKKL